MKFGRIFSEVPVVCKANDKQVSKEVPVGHDLSGKEQTGGMTDNVIERQQQGNNASGR
jgi:hypothetical protein